MQNNLAKDVKIQNLLVQRDYIASQLKSTKENPRENGDTSYIYIGHVFPENCDYFRREGYNVVTIKSDLLTALVHGRPVFLFTIGNDVTLTGEDLKLAQEAKGNKKDGNDRPSLPGESNIHSDSPFSDDFMSKILGGGF